MGKGISKRRLDMGEEVWAEYQRKRKQKKVIAWRKRAKWKLVLYKGGKCQECNYDKKIPSAYDFHHRIREDKKFGIAKSYHFSLARLKKEVDKCDLLCCRCHQELHHREDYSQ